MPTIHDPPSYHALVRDYLRTEEKAIWEWYASNRVQKEHAESVRFDLLKRTYRIERESQPALYDHVDAAVASLGVRAEVTLYQAQHADGLNASLAYLPGEAHIVLQGPVASKLNASELRGLFGHELGHLIFNEIWDGDLLIATQVLSAMTNDRSAETAHYETARLFSIFREVYCDRLASQVVGDDTDVIVSMLVKTATGLEDVDAESYRKQAMEVLQRASGGSEGTTHPEEYLRARAVDLWREDPGGADQRVTELIRGTPPLNCLDFIAQQQLAKQTRALVDAFFTPTWARTDLLLAHARLFFDGYEPPQTQNGTLETIQQYAAKAHDTVRDYLCYVLLDFASADRDLEEAPLVHCMGMAERLGFSERMNELSGKEFRLRKKQLGQLIDKREKIL
ncbi:MAG: M48 family metalloprotease, partial [Planctomycetota bacterium]